MRRTPFETGKFGLAQEIISMPSDDGDLTFAQTSQSDDNDESMDVELRELVLGAAAHGQRLDKVLAVELAEFSRSWLQQLLQEGCVRVNGQVVHKSSVKALAGSKVQVELRPTPQAQAFRPEAMPLDVVFEDEHLMVIVKPAGLVVHPATGHWSGTLLNGLLAYHAGASLLPRAGIVHRLDKDTSGLMLVAKSRQAMDALVKDIAERTVQRRYLALAHGRWRRESTVVVEQAIGRDPANRLRMAVLPSHASAAKPAKTTFHCVQVTQESTVLACQLHTGRTHQIRVHAAWLGHPLVADALYGGKERPDMARQALHAAHLQLPHPVSRKPLVFHATPPADVLNMMQQWGVGYNQAIWDAAAET
jgi:23S rRNA pseudouridine1911/1915/1917 synthase